MSQVNYLTFLVDVQWGFVYIVLIESLNLNNVLDVEKKYNKSNFLNIIILNLDLFLFWRNSWESINLKSLEYEENLFLSKIGTLILNNYFKFQKFVKNWKV